MKENNSEFITEFTDGLLYTGFIEMSKTESPTSRSLQSNERDYKLIIINNCMHIHIHLCTYVCAYVCVCTWTHTHTYINTHVHKIRAN